MLKDIHPGPRRRALLRAALGLAGASAAAGLAACGGGGGATADPADDVAPTLAGSSPPAGATGVTRSMPIALRFSEAVEVPPGAVTLSGPRGAVAATVTTAEVDGATVATVTPARPLGFGESYTVSASGAVRDRAGNRLAASGSTFTTVPRNPALALGAHVIDSYVKRRWAPADSQPWNVLPTLVDHGFEWLRVAVTTHSFPELRGTTRWNTLAWRNEYWSSLEMAGALLREGADLGMRLHAVLYFSDESAHWGKQRLPAAWRGLDEATLAQRVEQHGREVAQYYRSLGLEIEVFEIGNEIDAGAFGWLLWDTVPVPPGVDAVNDPAWMRANLWARVAPLLRAAMRGVQSVYPAAKLMLHVGGFGYSGGERAAGDFFESMTALGVPFDLAGLSFPYMMFDQGLPQPFFSSPDFLAALDRIAALGRPIQIVEVGYNAKPEGTAVKDPPFPYTPQGQADFFRGLATAVRGRVQSVFAFYPDWFDGLGSDAPELEGLGFFSAPGVPRPALGVFNDIAEGRLAG